MNPMIPKQNICQGVWAPCPKKKLDTKPDTAPTRKPDSAPKQTPAIITIAQTGLNCRKEEKGGTACYSDSRQCCYHNQFSGLWFALFKHHKKGNHSADNYQQRDHIMRRQTTGCPNRLNFSFMVCIRLPQPINTAGITTTIKKIATQVRLLKWLFFSRFF